MKLHNPSTRRRFIALAVAAVALLAVPLGAAPAFAGPDKSPVAKYVALGDSYAAGQGAGTVLVPGDPCLRTDSGYAAQLDDVTPVNDQWKKINLLRQPACSGATIADVMSTQLGSLNRGTTLVTVTAGANDLGLNEVTAACTPGMPPAGCLQALTLASTRIDGLGDQMQALVSAIHERSPRATIVVTGYPELFDYSQGLVAAFVNQQINDLNDELSSGVTAAVADGADAVFAQVSFGDHNIGGGGTLWLGFDLANPDRTNFMHPTVEGYAAYADAIQAALQ